MKRLNIYFIHSSKIDYNNLIYKKILSNNVCLSHNIILPMSSEYKEKYRKDLIEKADVIIVTLIGKPSLGLILELKWLQKVDKPKLFLSLDNNLPGNIKKYVNDVKFVKDDYMKEIENFIIKTSKDEEDKAKEGLPVTLGEL